MDKAEVLLENVERRETPGLRRIVLMDAVQPQLVERGQRCGVHVQAMQEVEVERPRPPDPSTPNPPAGFQPSQPQCHFKQRVQKQYLLPGR